VAARLLEVGTDPVTRTAVAVGLLGALLTGAFAVAAAHAGVRQDVALPDWWGPWPHRRGGQGVLWLVAGVITLGALCLLWLRLVRHVLRRDERAGTGTRTAVLTAGVAGAWALPLAVGGPTGSLDVQSYVAIGRLALGGMDPYVFGPGWLGDDFSAAVDPLWRWTPTPYGPLQVALLRGIAAVAGGNVVGAVLLVRLVAVLGAVAAVVLALRAARPADRVVVLVLTALSPVLLLHVVSGAHLDVLVGALALGVVGLTRRGRPVAAAALAVVAAALKLPGLVLLGYVLLDVLRRSPAPLRGRLLTGTAAVAAGVAVVVATVCPDPMGWVRALGVPGVSRGATAPSSWVSYLVAGSIGATSGSELDAAFTVGRAATALVGAAVVARLLWRATSGPESAAHAYVGWALLALAVSGPALYPWYLTWGLFCAAVGCGVRGRLLLTGLGAVLCVASAAAEGPLVVVVWLAVLTGVIAYLRRTGRAVLPGGLRRAVLEPSGREAVFRRPALVDPFARTPR
jgi:hypothetical protein